MRSAPKATEPAPQQGATLIDCHAPTRPPSTFWTPTTTSRELAPESKVLTAPKTAEIRVITCDRTASGRCLWTRSAPPRQRSASQNRWRQTDHNDRWKQYEHEHRTAGGHRSLHTLRHRGIPSIAGWRSRVAPGVPTDQSWVVQEQPGRPTTMIRRRRGRAGDLGLSRARTPGWGQRSAPDRNLLDPMRFRRRDECRFPHTSSATCSYAAHE